MLLVRSLHTSLKSCNLLATGAQFRAHTGFYGCHLVLCRTQLLLARAMRVGDTVNHPDPSLSNYQIGHILDQCHCWSWDNIPIDQSDFQDRERVRVSIRGYSWGQSKLNQTYLCFKIVNGYGTGIALTGTIDWNIAPSIYPSIHLPK